MNAEQLKQMEPMELLELLEKEVREIREALDLCSMRFYTREYAELCREGTDPAFLFYLGDFEVRARFMPANSPQAAPNADTQADLASP